MNDQQKLYVRWYANSMIENAKSLQQVSKELDKNISGFDEADNFLFRGKLLSVPILLSLATEIALKAWVYQEQKKAPARIHDLLKLFDRLEPGTRELLEARMRKVSPHSIWAEQPGMQNLHPHLQEMLAAKMEPLRDVLDSHKNMYTDLRYVYEKQGPLAIHTGELDLALTVIIDAYDDKWGASA